MADRLLYLILLSIWRDKIFSVRELEYFGLRLSLAFNQCFVSGHFDCMRARTNCWKSCRSVWKCHEHNENRQKKCGNQAFSGKGEAIDSPRASSVCRENIFSNEFLNRHDSYSLHFNISQKQTDCQHYWYYRWKLWGNDQTVNPSENTHYIISLNMHNFKISKRFIHCSLGQLHAHARLKQLNIAFLSDALEETERKRSFLKSLI